MASKAVVDRQRAAGDIRASAETHAQQVAQGVERALMPFARPGKSNLGVVELVSLLSRSLGAASDALVAADQTHLAELGDDGPVRAARDQVASRLRERLVVTREILLGLYGGEAVRALGFDSGTPEEPLALARFAQGVLEKLGKSALPKSRVAGARFDAAEAATELRALHAELERALQGVDLEAREAEATLVRKQAALDDYDARFTAVATVLEGLYRLAGLTELAGRLRPSVRRAGQTAIEEEPTPAAPVMSPEKAR